MLLCCCYLHSSALIPVLSSDVYFSPTFCHFAVPLWHWPWWGLNSTAWLTESFIFSFNSVSDQNIFLYSCSSDLCWSRANNIVRTNTADVQIYTKKIPHFYIENWALTFRYYLIFIINWIFYYKWQKSFRSDIWQSDMLTFSKNTPKIHPNKHQTNVGITDYLIHSQPVH